MFDLLPLILSSVLYAILEKLFRNKRNPFFWGWFWGAGIWSAIWFVGILHREGKF